MYKYFPHTEEDLQAMLSLVGVDSIDALYAQLPEEFTTKEAAMILGKNDNATGQQLSRWVKSGYIERKAQGRYKKLIAQIV